jgi:CHAT domain-containing protein
MMEEAALGRLEALIAQARWSEAATLAGRVDNRFSEAGRLTLLRQRARIRAEGGDWREAKQDLATAWASSWESDPARVAAQLPFALARLMAELELRHQGDARLALAYLERTRAAALGVSLSDTEAMRRLDALPDALSIHILGNRIGIWRLRGGKVQFAWSPVPVAAVSETAARFFRNCADPTSPVEQIERDGRRLFDWLIAPVGGEPGNAGSITVSLDEALSGLPLQALRDSRGWWQAAARMTPALVLTAEPSMEDMRSFGSFVIVAEPSLPASLRQNFPALPEATAEATWLAAHVPGKPIVLQGQAATVKRIRDELSTVDAFHFAGHGIGNGGAGGLLTASGELLTARDVTGSGSRTRGLAVLAACASLGGRLAGATASDGLVTAFLRAGFRNVVASRWNSDSLATAGIIRRFYEQLWNGVGPSESLTLGTSVIRNDKRTAHPYYWANLQEIGT